MRHVPSLRTSVDKVYNLSCLILHAIIFYSHISLRNTNKKSCQLPPLFTFLFNFFLLLLPRFETVCTNLVRVSCLVEVLRSTKWTKAEMRRRAFELRARKDTQVSFFVPFNHCYHFSSYALQNSENSVKKQSLGNNEELPQLVWQMLVE